MPRYPVRAKIDPEEDDPWTCRHVRLLDRGGGADFFRDVGRFLLEGGTTYWIAGEGGIPLDPLRLASVPGLSHEDRRKILERLRVRRGFTRDQLASILVDLSVRVSEESSCCLLLFSGFETSEILSPHDAKRLRKDVRRLFGERDPERVRVVFMRAARSPVSATPGEDAAAFSGRTSPLSAEVTMGRSVSTFRQQIEQEKRSWKPFRAHLSCAEQDVMDRLFETSRLYTYAGGEMSDRTHPFNVLLLSFVLDLARRLEALEEELRRHP